MYAIKTIRFISSIQSFHLGGEGSGFGLWISNSIVKSHNGDISILSDGISKGTTVRFRLHAYSTTASVDSSVYHMMSVTSDSEFNFGANYTIPAQVAEVRSSEVRVLVVDDVFSCRKMLQEICKRTFKTLTDKPKELIIDTADDGISAVHNVKTSLESGLPYDIVFIDYIMISMNGPEASKAIRSLGYTGKIVGISGNVNEEDVKVFLSSGADLVLSKPVKKDDLIAVLDKFSSHQEQSFAASKR